MILARTITILVALTSGVPAFAQDANAISEATIKTTVSLFAKEHLEKPTIDERFCQRWLSKYLETLDPSKSYFLADDISEFQSYVNKLPKLASTGKLDFCTLVTERYQARVRSALDRAIQRLDREFDFSIDERITLHYDNWPTTVDNRIDRWRLQLKYELLLERSHSPDTNDAIAFLKSRYESILKQADGITEQIAVGLYLDSFCRTADPNSDYFTQKEFRSFLGSKRRAYSIGLNTNSRDGGRSIIRSIGSEFRREPAASKILGCELLAIRTHNGDLYNFREIYSSTSYELVMFGLKQDAFVTLELYDEALKHRFSVNWPRKW